MVLPSNFLPKPVKKSVLLFVGAFGLAILAPKVKAAAGECVVPGAVHSFLNKPAAVSLAAAGGSQLELYECQPINISGVNYARKIGVATLPGLKTWRRPSGRLAAQLMTADGPIALAVDERNRLCAGEVMQQCQFVFSESRSQREGVAWYVSLYLGDDGPASEAKIEALQLPQLIDLRSFDLGVER